MAAAGYVGGRVHGWSERRDTEKQLEIASEEHQRAFEARQREHAQELERVTARADAQSSRAQSLAQLVTLYAGYRSSQQALSELDQRNFGTSESHLRNAAEILSPVAEHVRGLPEVLAQLRETNVAIAGDLQEQREKLLAIAARLDALIVNERPPVSAAGTTESSRP
jgi:chromosome segregation ATPase